MTRTTARTFIVSAWVATMILVLASTVFYYRLSRQVDHLARERDLLTHRYSDARADRNTLASNSIFLKNSLLAYQGFIQKTRPVLNGNCADDWKNRCARYAGYSDLLDYHSTTLLNRISAHNSTAYLRLLDRYRGTFSLIAAVRWLTDDERQRWIAIANEGVAYALWKLGRPEQARGWIDKALTNHGASPIIVSTHLKVRCASRDPRDDVRREYSEYRNAARARIQRLSVDQKADQISSVRFNLEAFSQDQELADVCRYALKKG